MDQLSNLDSFPQQFLDNGRSTALAFLLAAGSGNEGQLRYFIAMGVDVNLRYNGRNAVDQAARMGHALCLALLLDAGADVYQSLTRTTPLMQALVNERRACVDVLMAHEASVRNTTDNAGRTTLMCAASAGYVSVFRRLLSTVSDVPWEMARRGALGETVLNLAAIAGHVTLIRDVILPEYTFRDQFMQAVAQGRGQTLRQLLESDTDAEVTINSLEEIGIGPLSLSVVLDDLECARILLDFKAFPDAIDSNGRHALIYAAACGSTACLRLLISAGSTLSWMDKQVRTPLMMACRNGQVECASLLLDAIREEKESDRENQEDPSPSASDSPRRLKAVCGVGGYRWIKDRTLYGSVPAMRITSAMREERCDWTLPRVLANDPYRCDKMGLSALAYACLHDRKECVRLLLASGLDPNRQTHYGYLPMVVAAAYGHVGVASELANHSALVTIKDHFNNTPLQRAVLSNHHSMVDYLLSLARPTTNQDHFYDAALRHAAHFGYLESLSQIISFCSRFHGLDLNKALGHAAIFGHTSCVRLLLENGATFTEQTAYEAAYGAALCGHLPTLEMLVREHGVLIPSAKDTSGTLIKATCIGESPAPILAFLISQGAAVNITESALIMSPLMICCWKGLPGQTKVLLEGGADLTQRDKYGRPALVHAAIGGNALCLELVLEAGRRQGVDFQADSRDALQQLVNRENFACTRLLMERNLFKWPWYERLENKKFLLSNLINSGISPGFFMLNFEQFSPLKYALDVLDFAVVRFLLANFYLTEDDYRVLPRERRIRTKMLKESVHLPTEDDQVVKAIFTKPWPLSTLSLLTVSAAITRSGSPLPRAQAVEQLPIPTHFKQKLAFAEPIARLCTVQWKNLHREAWHPTYEEGILKPVGRTQVWNTFLTPCRIHKCACRGTRNMLTLEEEVDVESLLKKYEL